jgi:hypothetical protein
MRRILLILAGVLLVAATGGYLFLDSLGMFATTPVYTTERGAIDGYDPVAYFRDGRPVAGSEAHTLDWRGSRWRFASADNLEAFRLNPQRYAPQYGGYCAYGLASGYTTNTDPHAWTVVDGRLYLNFDPEVKAQWLQDQPGMIERADANWPGSRPARAEVQTL